MPEDAGEDLEAEDDVSKLGDELRKGMVDVCPEI